MAVANPPGFLQNAGATHTASQMRNWFAASTAGIRATGTPNVPRGGVNPLFGNKLQVTQAGSPNMTVLVKSGSALIPGTEGAFQSGYWVQNDADVTVTITAAHATLTRIDSIVFKVEDSAFSGVTNTSSIVCVAGTPSGSPVAPTLPNNSIELARVTIVGADTSITNGEITDRRFYLAALGGIIPCLSTTRPSAGTVQEGQIIYETDTDKLYITHDGGTAWVEIRLDAAPLVARKTADETVNGSAALQNDDHLVLTGVANTTYKWELRLNYTSGTTPDLKWGLTFPAGFTLRFGGVDSDTAGAVRINGNIIQTAVLAICGSGTDLTVSYSGIAIFTTGGSLQLQWAQNTSTGSNSTVYQGSYMQLEPVV